MIAGVLRDLNIIKTALFLIVYKKQRCFYEVISPQVAQARYMSNSHDDLCIVT